jgi:hypothetical protein
MKKLFFLLFISMMIISCTPSDNGKNPVIEIPTTFRLSDMKYYMNLQTITNDRNISPNLISKIDSANPFSFGFSCEMQKLHGGKASMVDVKARYFFPFSGEASIVCSVSKKDSVIFWQAKKINSNAGINKWIDVEKEFDFKKTYSADERLSVYFWSPKAKGVYIEELEVTPKE